VHPNHLIRSEMWDGARLTVMLESHRRGTKKTHYQLLAETPKSQYREIQVVYNGYAPEDGLVSMFGNHNGYACPVHMKNAEDGKFVAKVKVPPGWEFRFFFEVDKRKEIDRNYICEHADACLGISFEQNVIQVGELETPPPPKVIDMLRGLRHTKKKTEAVPEVKKRRRKRWEYEIPSLPEGERFRNLFNRDWREVQLNDVVPDPEVRKKIAEIMKSHWNSLQQIFRWHAGVTDPVQYMTRMTFVNLIGAQKMYGKNLKPSDTEDIFERVNIPEDYGSDDELEGIGRDAAGGFEMVEQEDNPENLFVRSEFLEAVVRLALRKYPDMEPDMAFESILENYFLKNGQRCLDEIAKYRNIMNEKEVRDAFKPYLKQLYKRVFTQVAGLDFLEDEEEGETISFQEYGSYLRYKGLLATSKSTARGLTRREACLAFALPIEPDQFEPQLKWDGFLEMVMRVAACLYKHSKNSYADAVRTACDEFVGRRGGHMKLHLGSLTVH